MSSASCFPLSKNYSVTSYRRKFCWYNCRVAWEIIFYHTFTTPFDAMNFVKALKNKARSLAQLAEQLTLNL